MSASIEALPFASLQGQCTVMSLTWPSSNCRRTIVWRSSRESGGMVASVQRKRTTVPKVCLWLLLLLRLVLFLIFLQTSLTSPTPSCCLSRVGYGEHWWHFRGVGVWPAGGYLHGSAGVCLDVKAGTRKWGERGLSNVHLLCLPLPSLAPSHSRSCQALPQGTALTERVSSSTCGQTPSFICPAYET